MRWPAYIMVAALTGCVAIAPAPELSSQVEEESQPPGSFIAAVAFSPPAVKASAVPTVEPSASPPSTPAPTPTERIVYVDRPVLVPVFISDESPAPIAVPVTDCKGKRDVATIELEQLIAYQAGVRQRTADRFAQRGQQGVTASVELANLDRKHMQERAEFQQELNIGLLNIGCLLLVGAPDTLRTPAPPAPTPEQVSSQAPPSPAPTPTATPGST